MMSLVFADWIWSEALSCSLLVARYWFSYKRVFFCFTMKMDGFEILTENFHSYVMEVRLFLELCLQLNFSSFFCWWEWGGQIYKKLLLVSHSMLVWSLIYFRALFYVWHFAELKSYLIHCIPFSRFCIFLSWVRKQDVLHTVAGVLQWIGLMCDAEITKSSSGKKGCREGYKWEELSV